MSRQRRDNGDGGLIERKVGGKVVGWVGTFDIGVHTGKDGILRRQRKAVVPLRTHCRQTFWIADMAT